VNIFLDCPIPWLVGPLAGAILIAAIVLIRRDVAHLGRGLRILLLSLAIIAGLQLVGLVLGPKIVRTWLDPMKPRCAVLADGSRSILIADTYAGDEEEWLEDHVLPERDDENPSGPPKPAAAGRSKQKYSREKIVRRVLARDEDGWLVKLEKDLEVTGVRFSTELEGLPLDADAAPFVVNKEEGYSTALGEAMQLAARAGRVRALILLSDGAWNDGADPSEVARVLGGQGIPVYVVGVGNPSPPRDRRREERKGNVPGSGRRTGDPRGLVGTNGIRRSRRRARCEGLRGRVHVPHGCRVQIGRRRRRRVG